MTRRSQRSARAIESLLALLVGSPVLADSAGLQTARLQLWQMSLEPAKVPANDRLGEMVKIPAGTFLMGNTGQGPNFTEDEFPQHAAELAAGCRASPGKPPLT